MQFFLLIFSFSHCRNVLNACFYSWQNDVFVVAEPGDLADKFLQSVKFSLLSMNQNHHRKITSLLANISTVADLVHYKPYFQVGNVIHRYIGRQTQVCVIDFFPFFVDHSICY